MAYDDGYGRPQVQLQFPPFQGWVKKLVLINGGIFLGLFFLGFFGQEAQGAVEQFLALDPPAWWGGFPPLWQPLTYGWLHSLRDPGHIFGNMLLLYFFGEMVQAQVGDRRFITHYVIALVLGGVVHLALAPLMGWRAPALGASGAVMAMVVAAAAMRPGAMVLFIVIPLKLWVLAAILVAKDAFFFLSELQGGGTTGVAHSIHLAGAAYGFLAVRRRWLWSDPLAALERKRAVANMERELSDEARMDQLMAKISREGIGSLTRGERAFMKRQSERKRQG